MISLKNIYKSYWQGEEEIAILKNINLEIEKGDYISIMGPSGSGKSTLMNIIGCLDKPTSGDYHIYDTDILNLNERQLSDLRNQSIGFVFQNFNLMPRLSVQKNVELPLIYSKITKYERSRRAVSALDKVGLSQRLSFRPPALSGGQKQRVAIARALVTNSDFILADEPTGALDTKTSTEIMALFDEFNKLGKTIIIITHEAEIADYTNRKIVIRDGEIISDERKEALDE
ncbi:ABC transporter ATP-binding protein [Carnobacterium divergens]|uniref:ABC transporter, ATP-binding protein n=2 Tax=Carnobacterium divergens TaxID=2748 RepID=A0A0R2HXH1_CARDV|nr:ABC transporter ATP-binding protein [Carnobacterium divergens]ANZ99365.1 macrolide ABC transporter ATP-binding protein [Carnobacterium divergens]KRN57288.1 ABC transporter, ATP-binding protein [Carnobacterium divergens DSM 20623]MDO0875389.1 ABC transporter ATP-binding protein [Carnobacterium divergens]MDT1957776.1 ABC transporter ATP-binding protein [Carnobacterium divergens]MDT1973404.1 ABC transporter ATP-binding protein [Carnobacterium divergens]